MGADEMPLRVLREVADLVDKPLSITSEKSGQTGKVPDDWKKAISQLFLRRVERMNEGTTDLSASPLCQGKSWNTWKLY